MKLLFGLTFIIVVLGCETTKDGLLEGDIFFGRFKNNYPGSVLTDYSDYINSLDFNDTLVSVDSIQRKTNLLLTKYANRHFVDILINGDSVVRLYMDSVDFKKINQFDYKKLKDEKKKVIIQARTTIIETGFYECEGLVKVNIVDGVTFTEKDKRELKF